MNGQSNKEHWINYNGINVGFVYVTDDNKKIYVTDRKKIFEIDEVKGFSISKGIFKILKQMNVKFIRIKLIKGDGCTEIYSSSVDNWIKKGKINYYGVSDSQLFLRLKDFENLP